MPTINPSEHLATLQSELFTALVAKAQSGTFYPEKDDIPAEYVCVVPELGWAAVIKTAASEIDNPSLIEGERCRPEIGRYAKYWITLSSIEVQHGTWEQHEPHDIDHRQPMNPEELIDLHELVVG